MGLFLSMVCIVDTMASETVDYLSRFCAEHEGAFQPVTAKATEDDPNLARLLAGENGVTVMLPNFMERWDITAQWLSDELCTTVFALHIHDGDFWMFVVFHRGREVAWFNPMPDYWGHVSPDERAKLSPNPGRIASFIQGVDPDRLDPYLIEWPAEGIQGKAHPEDAFGYIDWQVIDFMRELGFGYPDTGEGEAYRMTATLS